MKLAEYRARGSKHESRIAELYPRYTTSEIAEMLGICDTWVERLAKRLGVEHSAETMRRIKKKRLASNLLRAANFRDKMRELYPHYSAKEISDQLGYSLSYVQKIAKKMGLQHTPECYRRLKQKTGATMRRKKRLSDCMLLSGITPTFNRINYRIESESWRCGVQNFVQHHGYKRYSYRVVLRMPTSHVPQESPRSGEQYFCKKYGITIHAGRTIKNLAYWRNRGEQLKRKQ